MVDVDTENPCSNQEYTAFSRLVYMFVTYKWENQNSEMVCRPIQVANGSIRNETMGEGMPIYTLSPNDEWRRRARPL